MITIVRKDFNHNISKSAYETYIDTFDATTVVCTEGCGGTHTKHGFYKRSYYHNNNKCYIYILRIKCNKCNKTHAILPYFLLPYFLIPISDIINILTLYTKDQYKCFFERNYIYDESKVSYIKRRFSGCVIHSVKNLYQSLYSHLTKSVHLIEIMEPT
ncbi:hypothetical protein EDD63_1832 [Breznakia blatticola]|uniref:DUF6431 domain-containing protein n=1 Tax=Breznakia blatticola TaxID=1754012 RepID=A0A4R7ZF73_9FIRM|nr:hypothetical protein EDD63_1832 [Breznakia blatticola]